MFGLNNEDKQQDQAHVSAPQDDQQMMQQDDAPASSDPMVVSPGTAPTVHDNPVPFQPAAEDQTEDTQSPAAAQEDKSDSTDDEPASSTPSSTTSANSDALLDLKQQALQQLSPLVGHLDQTPEEKFRTTMMMIQATDNKDLLSTAYEAAQGISDEKERAQALLDVVNEINYFTQKES